MKKRLLTVLSFILLLAVIITGCGLNRDAEGNTTAKRVTLINVSYDPTRELYEAYNSYFAKKWKKETGQTVEVIQSHGGSGKQALEVANGLKADVVTLALAADTNSVARSGLIASDWQSRLPDNSCPYYSTIVLLVRNGNPKNIKDWDDLTRSDVSVVTPNPKTSGGARWNYLAAYAYALKKYDNDESQAREFMRKLYRNVSVLDSGARASTTSFTENGQGDVLICWENEAYLTLQNDGKDYELIYPSVSIKAETPVSVVDSVVKSHGTRKIAEAYLKDLYDKEAQEICAKNYYRPSDTDVLKEHSKQFPTDLEMVTIDDFGGWDKVTKKHFADGGIFDQIYE